MNVAYQFSGQLRDFKSIYPNLKENVLDPTNADVIAAVWDGWDGVKRFEDEGTFEEFIQLYKPKVSGAQIFSDGFLQQGNIKNLLEKAYKNKRSEIKPENVISQYYKWKSCNSLRKNYNHIDYDVIIKGRSEVTFERPITEEELNLAKTHLLIPKGHDSLGLHDVFAMGPPWLMDHFLEIIDYVEFYMDNGGLFHPELMLKNRMQLFEDPYIKRIDFPIYLRGERITDYP